MALKSFLLRSHKIIISNTFSILRQPGNEVSLNRALVSDFFTNIFIMYDTSQFLKLYTPCEARTHDLQIMRLTRCLLRQRGNKFTIIQAHANFCAKIDTKYYKNPCYTYHVKSIGIFELLLYTIRNAMFYGCQVISSLSNKVLRSNTFRILRQPGNKESLNWALVFDFFYKHFYNI